jgi:hypothetical protein
MISGETDRHRLVSGLQHSRNFVLTATFRPTECLLAPALCLPRAVLRGDDTRTRLRSPSRCLLGGPVSIPRSRYLNPSARDRASVEIVVAPARGGVWGSAPGPTTGRSLPENQRQPQVTKRPCWSVVGRLLDSSTEIAHSTAPGAIDTPRR